MQDNVQNVKKKEFYKTFFYCGLCLIFLISWAYAQYNAALNDNISWNLISAQKFLALNGPWSSVVYDTNPPLSAIIYVPAVWISALIPEHFYHGIFFFTLFFLLVCLLMTHAVLKRMDYITADLRTIILAAFIAGSTIATNTYNFGEREHFIGMAIFPLFLMQFALLSKTKIPNSLIALVSFFGAALILVKPHFGILPLFMVLWRMASQKRLNVIFDTDFVVLALTVISYALILFFYFPDFFAQILPDVVTFYLPNNSPVLTLYGLGKYAPALLGLVVCNLLLPRSQDKMLDRLIFWTLGMAFLCLIPFILQLKGLPYHLLPMLTFLTICCALTLYRVFLYLRPRLPSFSHSTCAGLTVLLTFSLSLALYTPRFSLAKHTDYLSNPLVGTIKKYCGQSDCRVFIDNENMAVSVPSVYYAQAAYASRFPSLWFSLPLLMPEQFPLPPSDLDNLKKRFSGMMIDDIETQKPQLLFIYAPELKSQQDSNLDLLKFLETDPRTPTILSHYKMIDHITLNRGYYFLGTKSGYEYPLSWDVYRLKNTPPNAQ